MGEAATCKGAQLSCPLFSWQNQLLAKGLLFVEEKIKLSEGKYEAALVERGSPDPAFDVGTAGVLLSKRGQPPVSDSPRPWLPGEAAAFRSESASRAKASCNGASKQEVEPGGRFADLV